MKVLVIGGGGREHALAWKCAASRRVTEVLVAPGNAGTALEPKCRNVDVAAEDIGALAAMAKRENVALTIVGPEAPLVAGVVDTFRAAGLACFGPTRQAAQLEGSKAFTKDFLQRHAIPTARSRTFTRSSYEPEWLDRQPLPLVIKASGLAAGKGVIIAGSHAEARDAATAMFEGRFGAAGEQIVVEEFVRGEEVSFIVMADGRHALALATSQDHKRRDDGDRGPNTGGMGAYSPAPLVTAGLHARIMREVIEPTILGLAADGTPYTGFLYAGLMIGPGGTPIVLEFNCRFGDPETQPVLSRLQSDLPLLCEAALDGRLDTVSAEWDPRAALGVVLAAGDYPDAGSRGERIEGLDRAASLVRDGSGKVFHAGTRLSGSDVLTNGGRVLCAVGMGSTVADAQQTAYRLAGAIHWPGMRYRRDIGYRAIAHECRS